MGEEVQATIEAAPVRGVMQQLRESGVRLSIDDFGTGYSSLSYLSALPIDEVKIDRSFINGVEFTPALQSIVRSTVTMAHELGLIVVAEGIETKESLKFLRENHCDRAQGYLISKPLQEDQFASFLRRARLNEPAA